MTSARLIFIEPEDIKMLDKGEGILLEGVQTYPIVLLKRCNGAAPTAGQEPEAPTARTAELPPMIRAPHQRGRGINPRHAKSSEVNAHKVRNALLNNDRLSIPDIVAKTKMERYQVQQVLVGAGFKHYFARNNDNTWSLNG